MYRGNIIYKDLTEQQSERLTKCLNSNLFGEAIIDTIWLTVNNRLSTKTVIRWCNVIASEECLMPHCNEKETIEHLLVECERSKQIWTIMRGIGLNLQCNVDMIYANFNAFDDIHVLYWFVVCVTVSKIWRSR